MAERRVTTVADLLQPRTRPSSLLKGRFQEAVCGYGINHPTYEGSFCATTSRRRGRRTAVPPHSRRGGRSAPAELVAMTGSVH